jgi:hypothetical protein
VDILTVIVPGLQRVVLKRDQIESYIIEVGFPGRPAGIPGLSQR